MKRKKIYIMNGDIPVAESRGDNYLYRINPEVEAPIGMFYKRDKASIIDYMNWLKHRVFPKERAGVEDLLKIYNLNKYDAAKILHITHGRMIQDNFWVKWV